MGTPTALTSVRDFTPIQCGQCGIEFWVPTHWQAEKANGHEGFHCPNGHSRIYQEGEIDQLKRELQKERERLAEAQRAVEWEQKRGAKLDKDNRKLKRRIAAGVCPCCHRTFTNLARHMTGQHPDFAPPVHTKNA